MFLTDDPIEAAQAIREGGIVAFPTETVYGLGADARNADAVAAVFEAKGRPPDNPLIVHLADFDGLADVAREVPATARAILAAFSPGPVTVVLPRADGIPPIVSAGLPTVGVRIPAHDTAHAFLSACGTPVAAPSANRSGRPSPTTWDIVLRDLDGRIDGILRGPRSRVGLESTVVDCTVDPPLVLRAGTVTVEAIRDVIGTVDVAGPASAEAARSPGTRHPHYAPSAVVRVVDRPLRDDARTSVAYIGLESPPDGFGLVCVVRSADEYAHELYDFFRRCDALELDAILCQAIPREGVGRALMDRIERASDSR